MNAKNLASLALLTVLASAGVSAQTPSPAIVSALVDALKDPDADVREQVVWALGRIGSDQSVDPLIRLLGDSSPDVRSQVAWALGRIASARATDALTAALKDDSLDVRRSAAQALAAIYSRQRSRPALSPDGNVRP